MNNTIGGFGWGALVSLILSTYFFAQVFSHSDKIAIETGVVKLDKKYFTITPLEPEQTK